ncbi:MAG TPA: ATP/GTP-binding protein [Actinomycetota bacterium]|nr:ATP/GTP-binding protein [Actinomycetota bacterium]
MTTSRRTRGDLIRRSRGTATSARPLKIVITGPYAAGKTTLIRTISEVAVVATEKGVSDDTRSVKSQTTVAMDFGRISFAEDLSLFLFGTPGQRRFEVMWDVLSEGMIGFIVLVNAADERSLDEAAHILGRFRRYADVPFVIGVTHAEDAGASLNQIVDGVRETLEVPDGVEIVVCDPRSKDDVKALVLHILVGVMARLEQAAAS